jgi:group I intron endonuclease
MKKTGIYKIVNTLNNKVYVGSAIDIDTRWRRHKKMLIECYHHSKKLQNSYNKHGINNFNYEIIELCEKHLLTQREQYWIESFDSYNNGYNSRPIAGSNLGLKLPISEETRKKIGLKSKGRKHTEEAKQKIKEKRKSQIFSEETRKKISDLHKGKIVNEETRKKISEANKGRAPINKGKTYEEIYGKEKAEELKLKRKINGYNSKISEEGRNNINKNRRGKTYEEIYGKEKAEELKLKRKLEALKRRNK